MEVLEHFRVSVTIGFDGEEQLDEPMEAWLLIYSYQNRVNLLIIFFLCNTERSFFHHLDFASRYDHTVLKLLNTEGKLLCL
jgi:hypothetical protein